MALEPKKEVKHFTRIIPREEWGALPPKETSDSPLKPPIDKIHYSFHRNWPQCFTQEDCSETVRMMQLREMNERGFPDVRHNFMIGNDCNVYEGRGWYRKPKPANEYLVWDDKAIDIGFFAEEQEEVWSMEEMFGVAEEFIEYGIKNKLITKHWVML